MANQTAHYACDSCDAECITSYVLDLKLNIFCFQCEGFSLLFRCRVRAMLWLLMGSLCTQDELADDSGIEVMFNGH
jgi:hypothetical protein